MDFALKFLLILLYVAWLPVTVCGRLLGRDPLQLRRPPGSSYWLVRHPRTGAESYFSQSSLSEGRPAPREGAPDGPRVGARPSALAAMLRCIARFTTR